MLGARWRISLRGAVLALGAFLAIVTAIAANKMIVHAAWPLLVALVALDLGRGRILPRLPWGLAALLAAALAWGGAGVLWSVDPALSLSRLGKVGAVALGAVLLLGASRRLEPGDTKALGLAVAAGVAAALGLAALGLATGGAFTELFYDPKWGFPGAVLSELNSGLSAVAIFAWCALLYLVHAGRNLLAAVLGAAALATFWTSEGAALALGATAGAVAFALALKLPGRAATWLGIAAAAWILAAPFAAKGILTAVNLDRYGERVDAPSVVHRLHIWRFAADKVLERPLLGYGLGTSRVVSGAAGDARIRHGNRVVSKSLKSLHPHNGPLQWWLELGFPGALLGGLGVFLLLRAVAHVPRPLPRALLVGQFVTAFSIFNLSFGAWEGWWLATFALAAFLTLVLLEGMEAEPPGEPSGSGVRSP